MMDLGVEGIYVEVWGYGSYRAPDENLRFGGCDVARSARDYNFQRPPRGRGRASGLRRRL